MPLAVTHVLTTAILIDLYRDYISRHKRFFTLHTVFLGAFFGLIPDIDIALRMVGDLLGIGIPWILQHRGITHTPFFALLFLIPWLILLRMKKEKTATYFFVGFLAVLWHIALDFLVSGDYSQGIMWLYPLSYMDWKIELISFIGVTSLPEILDAMILLFWLWHEEMKHKISDFL